jgi:hypothetical protein
MLAKLLDGFNEAIRDAVQETAVSEGCSDYALSTGLGDEISVNEELRKRICQYLARLLRWARWDFHLP